MVGAHPALHSVCSQPAASSRWHACMARFHWQHVHHSRECKRPRSAWSPWSPRSGWLPCPVWSSCPRWLPCPGLEVRFSPCTLHTIPNIKPKIPPPQSPPRIYQTPTLLCCRPPQGVDLDGVCAMGGVTVSGVDGGWYGGVVWAVVGRRGNNKCKRQP
eukprot:361612-Chlamydomonas_euryale.AAC.9